MSRKGQSKIRKIENDTVYDNYLVSRLINRTMKDGKKGPATKQVYSCLDMLNKHFKKDPVIVLEEAVENIKPKVEVRPRRIGGAVYQVPTLVRNHRQISLALRWMINAARELPNGQYKTFAEKLFNEIVLAIKNEGNAIKKRLDVEKMAEANKAFSHLRW